MNEMTNAASVRDLGELKTCCQELADRVRTETLSRWSMQQTLKARFPQCSEADVVTEMQEALRRTLEGEGEL